MLGKYQNHQYYYIKLYCNISHTGQKQKTEERKKERLNDGNNNVQATHGARKHAWRTQATWAKKHYFLFFSTQLFPSEQMDSLITKPVTIDL